MSIDAIAVVRIPYAAICEARGLPTAPGPIEARQRTPPFVPVGEDGTAIFTGLPFSAEPAAVAGAARLALGALADGHDDERGVLIIPDKVWQNDVAGYAALVDDAGEMGEWAPMPSEQAAQAAAMASLGQAVPPGLVDQLAQAQMGGMPVLSALGGMDMEALQAQMKGVQQLMENSPATAKAAQAMMENMAGGDGDNPLAAMMGGADVQGGGLLQMAQEMLSQMSPEQRASLEQMAMSMLQPADDDETDDED